MSMIHLRCQPLDDLLAGGIESGIITKIYGEAGSGKTNLCLQATRECARQGHKVAYIDTEGVSGERLRQLCGKTDYKNILDNILFFNPQSFDIQEEIINDVITRNDICLIIVDTFNMLYRIRLEKNRENALRSFIRQMTTLQLAARQKDIYIIVVEQVFTDKNGEIKPFTHRDSEHMVKTSIRLERKGIGERQATIMKHRFLPEASKATFKITNDGLK